MLNNADDVEVGDFVLGSGLTSGTTVTAISGSTITLSDALENSMSR